ncbi:hypothetical protein BRC78_07095 [Halobacteriales archaeon QH_8_68_33]|nr:MAG: hypothetical protein BRC78_07095 [Halobacteriales archaeon QH_8_68_33]
MRRVLLTALVSVALVTATGALGAVAVDDAADGNATANATDPGDTGDDPLELFSEAVDAGPSAAGDAPDEDPNGSEGGGDWLAPGNDTALAGANGTDSDGDGLPDAEENDTGTDPFTADTDGDGLADARELSVGTDPTVADTDGDRLPDGWEFRHETPDGAGLPGADPLSMDLYVQVDYAEGADRRGVVFYRALKAEFSEMPVDNPDNTTGVSVHVRDGGRLNESVRFTGDIETFWSLKDRYYESSLGPRAGVYHQVIVAPFAAEEAGYGEVGGEFAVVASDLNNGTQKRVTTHELLHNVVGRVEAPGACADDPRHYCEGGYLGPHVATAEDPYLAEPLAEQLERQGFAD